MTRGGWRLSSALDLGLRERRSLGFARDDKRRVGFSLGIGFDFFRHRWKCFRTKKGPAVSVYSSNIWRSKGAACMQSSCAIFFRAVFKAELGQGSTVTTKGRRSFG
jgi:hypothetical protein